MAAKMGLLTILKHFKVTVSEKTKRPFEFSNLTVVPTVKGGIWLNFEKI